MRTIMILTFSALFTMQGNGQWYKVYQGSTNDYFNGLSFVNDSVGFTTVNTFVNDGVDFYQLNMIWKTADYGISWDTLYTDIDYCQCPSDSLYSFADIYFLNENLGWVCAAEKDEVWRTTNGGETWQIIDTGLSEAVGGPIQASDFANIVFHNENYGIVQNGNGGLHSMESFDGGITWELNDIFNCWDISMVDSCNIGLVDGGVIKSISNCNYSIQPFPTSQDIPNRNGNSIEYWNNQSFICGAGGFNGTSNFASVMKTMNGGFSYNILDLLWAFNTTDIEFFDELVGYLGVLPYSESNPDAILKSIDGGYTWYSQEIEQNQSGYPGLDKIRCPSAEVGYGITFHEVYRTINGGGELGNIYASVENKCENLFELKIYPNPTSSAITVSSNSTGILNVALFDLLGRKIVETSSKSKQVILDMNAVVCGCYFVRIELENGECVVKQLLKE